MKLVSAKEIPAKRRSKKKLCIFLEMFYESGMSIAKVIFDDHDYKSAKACYNSLQRAAKRYKLPIKVYMRRDEVYLMHSISNKKEVVQ